jgi:hypothetical protein
MQKPSGNSKSVVVTYTISNMFLQTNHKHVHLIQKNELGSCFFLSLYWAFFPLWQSPKSGWCAHAPGATTRCNNPCTKKNMYLASPCSSGDFIGIPQPPQQPSRGNPRYGGLRRARAEPNRSGMETVSWTPAECNVKSCCLLFFIFCTKVV